MTLAMSFDVRFGFALLGAAGFTAVALISLPWGIALWLQLAFVAGAFLDLYPALTAGVLVLMVAWLGELIRGRTGERVPRDRRWIYVLTPLLAAWLLLSVTWAADPLEARGAWLEWARSLAVFFVVATTVREVRHLRLIAGAFVCGAVISLVLGLIGIGEADVTAPGAAPEGRLTGGAGDPNFLAAGLVAALVLAVALIATARTALARALLVAAVPLMVVGIVFSQSRGALIGLAVVVVAAVVFASGERLRIVLATGSVVAVAAAAFALNPAALDRVTDGQSGGSGRSDLWTVAWRVTEDHPVVGVGLDNYKVVAADYVRRPGSLSYVSLIADRPHVVHNTYLGLLAESGVIGIALFLLVALPAAGASWRAARGFDRLGRAAEVSLARAVLIAVIGMLAMAFFLSAGADPRLWVLLALGPALLSAAEHVRRPDVVESAGAGRA
jgi:O-antigen ligase